MVAANSTTTRGDNQNFGFIGWLQKSILENNSSRNQITTRRVYCDLTISKSLREITCFAMHPLL